MLSGRMSSGLRPPPQTGQFADSSFWVKWRRSSWFRKDILSACGNERLRAKREGQANHSHPRNQRQSQRSNRCPNQRPSKHRGKERGARSEAREQGGAKKEERGEEGEPRQGRSEEEREREERGAKRRNREQPGAMWTRKTTAFTRASLVKRWFGYLFRLKRQPNRCFGSFEALKARVLRVQSVSRRGV